jgi:hypothetical protein
MVTGWRARRLHLVLAGGMVSDEYWKPWWPLGERVRYIRQYILEFARRASSDGRRCATSAEGRSID